MSFLIRTERLFLLIATLVVYTYFDLSWVTFLIGIMLPDLAMVGYALGNEKGALIYNIFHTYILSALFVCLGLGLNNMVLLTIGLIWTAHNSFDRLFGFGLKYKSGFKNTHLTQ